MPKQLPFERDENAPVRTESARNEKGSAMEMIRNESAHMRDKTTRLRSQRLAQEAAEAAAVVPEKPKRAPRKKAVPKA